MASFILKLLTPTVSNGFSFLESTISEFYSQEDEYNNTNENTIENRHRSFCYTFNEKLSLHKNAQKELSFSMLKNIWLGDSLETNPFVNTIHNGSQLLLIDKYGNEMFFTVKNIDYVLGSQNITYNVSCQDSFTYQTIRQNDGYTIENDIDSEDFIGAKTIDWWVVNKIKPECHLTYTYVPLFQGLYLDKIGNLKPFFVDQTLTDVDKVIKPAYSKEKYPQYYETFPFAVSGSNASAALISLGQEIGLMLNIKEHNIKDVNINEIVRTSFFNRYFWFEPEKHEETADLRYSPNDSIQSFSFSHAGDSLTTVLNVEANTINDEIITLLPDVPLFFNDLLISEQWNNTEYYDGYFTSICQNKIFKNKNGTTDSDFQYNLSINTDNNINSNENFIKTIDNISYLYIKIKTNAQNNLFKVPSYYNKINFEYNKDQSYIYYNEKRYTPTTSIWNFVERKWDKVEKKWIDIIYNDSYSLIPNNLFNKEINAYIKIQLTNNSNNISTLGDTILILNFFRDAAKDELDFAKVADACPWLENKLIDFSYFYKQNIINKNEYNILLNILKNKLRIVNGKLLVYSKQYYEAIHKKTEILSKLTADIDSIGAAFNADVIDKYATQGSINDINYFENAYKELTTKYLTILTPTPIINYEELLTEYINKYFKAQQRFLKNIYNFRKFFNAPIQWSNANMALYRHKIIITPPTITPPKITPPKMDPSEINAISTYRFLSFQVENFKLITKDFNLYNKDTLKPYVDIFAKDKKSKIEVVHKDNITQMYIPKEEIGSFIRCDSTSGYNPKKTYYRNLYRTEKTTKNLEQFSKSDIILGTDNNYYSYYGEDEDYIYYGSAKPDSQVENWRNSITLRNNNIEITLTLVKKVIPYDEIITDYLYKEAYQDKKIEGWFYHNSNTNKAVSNWLNDNAIKELSQVLLPYAFLSSFTTNDNNSNRWDVISNLSDIKPSDIKIINKNIKTEEYKTTIKDFYVQHFPVTTFNYTGPKYKESPFTFIYTDANKQEHFYETTYQRVNENNETVQQYIDYWYRLQNGETDLTEIKNPTDYITTYSLNLVTPDNENQYYRRVVKNSFWGGLVGGLPIVCGLGLGAAGAATYNIISSAVWKHSKTAWAFSGKNTRYADDTNIGEIYSGYVDLPFVNYTTSEDAYDNYKSFKTMRQNNDFILNQIVERDTWTDSGIPIKFNDNNEWNGTNEVCLTWNKDSNGNKKYLISQGQNSPFNFKDYFNYYSSMGFTYHSLINEGNGNITFKDSYICPLHSDDKISLDFQYKMLIQWKEDDKNNRDQYIFFEDNFDIVSKWGNSDRISKILYYPLVNNLIPVDFSVLEWNDNELSIFLGDALDRAGYKGIQETNYWFEATVEEKYKIRFMIFREEDFNYEPIITDTNFKTIDKFNYLKTDKRYSLYSGNTVYDKKNSIIVNFLKQADLVEGLFTIVDQPNNFIQATEKDFKTEYGKVSTQFYKQNEGKFERIYTIDQLKRNSQFYYYLNSNSYVIEDLTETPSIFEIKVYANTLEVDASNKILGFKTKEIDDPIKFDRTGKVEWIDKDTQEKYISKYRIIDEKLCDISGLTNGEFWYYYHAMVDKPLLFEKAALIETTLTQYWQQAYNASKYCEYFLPEYWQANTAGNINYFAAKTIAVMKKSANDVNIKILNDYIPEVEIYQVNNIINLPKYNIMYNNKLPVSSDSILRQININNQQLASDSLKDNKAFQQAFSELGESMINFTTEEIGETNYYYATNGGTKWNKVLDRISTNKYQYDFYNGIYVMQYKILKQYFMSSSLSQYKAAKEQHDNIWNNLYSNFSGIILESTYENKNATTSSDLFTLATNAFKDLSEPERNYNISIIDIPNLQGYIGQELSIGDSILVDSEDFYNENDDVKKTLSQYLFITDISYDLRKDSDISLTVNSIKYQEKLIQRLVKLIK